MSDPREQAARPYREHGPAVYRRCLRLLKDREAARDATQEVFVKLVAPGLQEPLLKQCTSASDRAIPAPPCRVPRRTERLLFPAAGLLVASLAAPRTALLLGLFFLGNLLRESGAAEGLSHAIRTTLLDLVTALFGLGLGLAAAPEQILTADTLAGFALGGLGLCAATVGGVLAVKALNALPGDRVNPLVGAAGAVLTPDAARLAQVLGSRKEPSTYLGVTLARCRSWPGARRPDCGWRGA